MNAAPVPRPRRAAAACAVLLLAGCAGVAPDRGFGAVAETTRARIGA